MKDLVISKKRQKKELIFFMGCLLCAFLLNAIAIMIYETDWSELWTQSLWVLLVCSIFYGVSVVVRLLYYGIQKIFD